MSEGDKHAANYGSERVGNLIVVFCLGDRLPHSVLSGLITEICEEEMSRDSLRNGGNVMPFFKE